MRRRPISGWGAAVVLCAGLSGCSHDHRVAAPVLGPHDGLPASLVSGQHYTATFTATFPSDWPAPDPRSGVPGPTLMMAFTRGIPDDGPSTVPEEDHLILCSQGELDPAGTTVTLTCPMKAPSPGPLILAFTVGGDFVGQQSPAASASFTHTVR